MELDLQSARTAREVEAQVKGALARLPLRAQKDVLERVVVDVLAALGAEANKTSNGAAKRVMSKTKINDDDGPRLWEQIVAYCESHPAPNGKFRTADVADAIIPDRMKDNRNSATSTIFTAVKRKSKGVANDFRFVWLGNGRFRLATDDEMAGAE